MRRNRRKWIVAFTLLALSIVGFLCAFSESAKAEVKTEAQICTLCSSHTYLIIPHLSFADNEAICKGRVIPQNAVDVTVTVFLYQKDGSSWKLLCQWTGSAANGKAAYAEGRKQVSSGTYKVVVAGNVGNVEYPQASITKTKE